MNRLKWHTHSPEKCCTKLCWLKNKDGKSDGDKSNAATANVSDENDAYDTSDGTKDEPNSNDFSSNPSNPSDLQALLASAMNLVSDNDVLKDHIADALNASLGAWQLILGLKQFLYFYFTWFRILPYYILSFH